MKNYRSPLSTARGMGAAGHGSHHWWMQRVTAVLLIPLTFWLVYSLALFTTGGFGFEAATAWYKCRTMR